MCLLLFKPADKIIPDKHLVVADRNNPHGCGIAVAMGDRIIIEKAPTWSADHIIKLLNKYEGHPAIVHFRYATHGSKNVENTHPFRLNDDWVAAHNGIISNVKTLEDESDTRAFLRLNVIPMLENNWKLTDEDVIKLLSHEMGTGNKMTFMDKEGNIAIANESAGHWNEGIWYSNGGYKTCNYYAVDDDYDYEQAYWDSQYYEGHGKAFGYGPPYHPVTPPIAPSYSTTKFSAFGKVIEETDENVSASALMVLPDKVNNYKENWLTMDTLNTTCDCCHEEIWGPFAIETSQQMIVCKDCCRFLPTSLRLPHGFRPPVVEVTAECMK